MTPVEFLEQKLAGMLETMIYLPGWIPGSVLRCGDQRERESAGDTLRCSAGSFGVIVHDSNGARRAERVSHPGYVRLRGAEKRQIDRVPDRN